METTQRRIAATLDGAPYRTEITARGITAIADEPADHGIHVEAVLDRTQEGRAVESRIHLEVSFSAELPSDQRERLLQIAGACPVHRTLESPIHLTRSLKP